MATTVSAPIFAESRPEPGKFRLRLQHAAIPASLHFLLLSPARPSFSCCFVPLAFYSPAEQLGERRAALAFIETELVSQTIFGDGLLAYQSHARHVLEREELLISLRNALDARPDLWHAWSAVIRQLVEMDRAGDASELSVRAVERFPLLPSLWFDRAIVCRSCANRDGEVDALQHALQIRPGWGMALRRLAEVYERDGRHDDSLELFQRAVARAPLEAVNHGCLADALWRKGDQEPAVRHLQQALRLDPGYEWAWNALRDWARTRKRPEMAVRFARQLTERRPEEARSWLMLARMLGQPSDLEKQLAALDRAIAINPRCIEAYDLKAMTLARAKRYSEAMQACQSPVWDGEMPLILRGRAAWVESERGKRGEAIQRMKAALADDRDYYWGWENLTEWAREENANADYLEGSENLVRLAPENAVCYGYRGDARQRGGDRAGGKADFRRALELDPAYRFAGLALFDEQMTDNELDDAARTLAVMKEHASHELVVARAVQLAARRGDRAKAMESLQALCTNKTEGTWPLESAVTALDKAGWAKDTEQMLRDSLDLAEVNTHVGSVWIDRHAARKDWSCERHFDVLLPRGAIGRAVVVKYAKALAKNKERDRLRECIRRHGAALREDIQDWGNVGYCFATLEDYPSAVEWMKDWPQRQEVQSWMLINLAISLRGVGDDTQANGVSRHALELKPDYTTPYHRTWLALDAALTGDSAGAIAQLKGLDVSAFDKTHKYVHCMIEALLGVQQASPRENGAAFARARQGLDEASRTLAPLTEDRLALLHTYRRCVRRLAHDRGGMPARLWSRWRCWRPLLPPAESPKPNGISASR